MDDNNDGTLSISELKDGLVKARRAQGVAEAVGCCELWSVVLEAGVAVPPDLYAMMDRSGAPNFRAFQPEPNFFRAGSED